MELKKLIAQPKTFGAVLKMNLDTNELAKALNQLRDGEQIAT